MKKIIGLMISCLLVSTAYANDSSYSKLNFDKDCTFDKPANENEASMGATAICKINGKPDIYFEDGDLRHSVGFGAKKIFESFGAWNSMNTTIEWRHDNNGDIFAAIVRFFIDHPNPETGTPDKTTRGQILAIHNVAKTINDETCVTALVDARANENPNVIARQMADEMAQSFNCITQAPKYYGSEGEYSAAFNKPMQPLESPTEVTPMPSDAVTPVEPAKTN
ncbi:MAG: hypothetical protein COB24_06945 [Hyphomicrobiales bacterium]|nr:MAG: hypothetical protein COB24_06945 [Hyphomicrobiales bacterium]